MICCNSAFEQGNLDLWRYINAFIIIYYYYIYLGICFWNGSFFKANRLLHDKASKAMYSHIQKGRKLNLPTDIMLKLFDIYIEPTLLDCYEVWGYENVYILEKGHTKFVKLIFGVSKYSHNMPVNGS